MLELDTDKRITAEQAKSVSPNKPHMTMLRSQVEKVNEQALAHPYLAQYADPTDEPASLPYDQVRINVLIVVPAFGQTLMSLFLTFLFSSDF